MNIKNIKAGDIVSVEFVVTEVDYNDGTFEAVDNYQGDFQWFNLSDIKQVINPLLKWVNVTQGMCFKDKSNRKCYFTAHHQSMDNLVIMDVGSGYYATRKEELTRHPEGDRT